MEETERKIIIQNFMIEDLSQLFKLLGDQSRIEILNALNSSELCVGDISTILKMNQSAVSHHLKVLREARIIKSRKNRKNVFYSLNNLHISRIIKIGSEYIFDKPW
ncbi:MAG: metalloregulator ArsR/SmtB family transcription factor [Chlorobiaceae bacterium]